MADPNTTNTPTNPAHAPGTLTPEQQKQAAEAAAKNLAERRAEAVKKLDEEDKARVEAVIDTAQRQAKYRPTPTQRETDLNALGLLDKNAPLEDDGSGPEVPPHNIRRSGAQIMGQQNEPYKTREATSRK